MPETLSVEVEDSIACVTLNRPEKRNAMSPTLNAETIEVLDAIELDREAAVLALADEGDARTGGMGLKDYFREVDASPEVLQEKIRRNACRRQWQLLRMYAKPAITMVNDWCFGGGLSPLTARGLPITTRQTIPT